MLESRYKNGDAQNEGFKRLPELFGISGKNGVQKRAG